MVRIKDTAQRRDDLQDRDKARNVPRQDDGATSTNDLNPGDDSTATQRPPPMATRVVEFEESSFDYARALSVDQRDSDISWITHFDANITSVAWSRVIPNSQRRVPVDFVNGLEAGSTTGSNGFLSNGMPVAALAHPLLHNY